MDKKKKNEFLAELKKALPDFSSKAFLYIIELK
jgi:hypothetical protein